MNNVSAHRGFMAIFGTRYIMIATKCNAVLLDLRILCTYSTYWIITARKRSWRRLCFYRYLSVHNGGRAWLLGGRALLLGGACMVAPGGHAWLLQGGMCGCSAGACMVFSGGCAWFFLGRHGFFGGMRDFFPGGVRRIR